MFWGLAFLISLVFVFGDFSYYFYQLRKGKHRSKMRKLSLAFSAFLPMITALMFANEVFLPEYLEFVFLVAASGGSTLLAVLSRKYLYSDEK